MIVTDEMVDVAAKQERAARRAVRPVLVETVAGLKAIFDKKRYQRYTEGEWTADRGRALRIALLNDADWVAFRGSRSPVTQLITAQLRKAAQVGALETAELTDEHVNAMSNISIDWDLTRSELADIGHATIQGYTHQENASAIWDALVRRMDASLRQAARKAKSMSAVRTIFNRNADTAIEDAVRTLERLVGDGVWNGHRSAVAMLEKARLRVA